MNIIYTDRSRIIAAQRCRRLRWLSYHEGKDGMGLEPARKGIHLVVGGAVHSGMEVLLREGQTAIDLAAGETLDAKLVNVFDVAGEDGRTVARGIEDRAVRAALADLSRDMGTEGVELDAEEAAARVAAASGSNGAGGAGGIEIDFSGMPTKLIASAFTSPERMLANADSPIVIDFSGLVNLDETAVLPLLDTAIDQINQKADRTQFESDYLREELSALVEGMVRAWGRRRWRGTLEQFEVMEVEREGEWRLGEVQGELDEDGDRVDDGRCANCGKWQSEPLLDITDRSNDRLRRHPLVCKHCLFTFEASETRWKGSAEIHFLSRHDALLRDRATDFLYLQSFKTTGSWDRRKELDAQVDMQGLSEAVDVDKRFARIWEITHHGPISAGGIHGLADKMVEGQELNKLGSLRVVNWIADLSDPPSVLGVRYEYLLKGPRKKDTKQGSPTFGRWNQESILIRAYRQTGITSTDDRWAWTYDWFDNDGRGGRKSRRLDYRSWQKAPVWKSMPVSEWIDKLDRFEIQEGAEGETGEPLDALGEQFVPVMTVYRNRDETLDWLEQTEFQEVQIARDVEAVRQAEQEGGYAAKRTKLNQLFPQTRSACSYPGLCQFRSTPTSPGICFGAPGAEGDPMVLERFRSRVPNHPMEPVQGGGNNS